MKYFQSPEANLFFSIAVLIENKILKVERKLDKEKITINNYVKFRRLIYDLGFRAKKTIETNSDEFVGRKAYHHTTQQKTKTLNSKGDTLA